MMRNCKADATMVYSEEKQSIYKPGQKVIIHEIFVGTLMELDDKREQCWKIKFADGTILFEYEEEFRLLGSWYNMEEESIGGEGKNLSLLFCD